MEPQQDTGRDDPTSGPPGNVANHPHKIPLRGWWQVVKRAFTAIDENNLSLLAAGVAFYLLLALFPLMTGFLSLYGLLADPVDLGNQLTLLSGWVPEQAIQLLQEQLEGVVSSRDGVLGIGVAVSFVAALWGGAKGSEALARALNVTYRERSERNIVVQRIVGMCITFGLLGFMLLAVVTVAVISVGLELLYLPDVLETAIAYLRWPLLWMVALIALATLYRFVPERASPRWVWLSPGALISTVLWLAGSALFSLYASHFGSYNEAYGSLGAVLLLMLWFWLTAVSVLLGAQLNAELEYQTQRDTTTGEPQPIGSRGAHVADRHVGD